jgi:hypothetical protein
MCLRIIHLFVGPKRKEEKKERKQASNTFVSLQ